MIEFTVIGRPQPAGSKTAFVNPKTGRAIVTDAAKGSRPWKQQVAGEAMASAGGRKLEGPVRLEVEFYLRRPKSHFGSGKNAYQLKDSAPSYPVTRPDTTKLLRAVEDAMSDAGVWGDDAQVVAQCAFKLFGDPERCEVTAYEVGSWPAAKEKAA